MSRIHHSLRAVAHSLAALFLIQTSSLADDAPKASAPIIPDLEINESTTSFESQGKTIAVERFEPKAKGKYPAVIVLHGSGGMILGGPLFRDLSRRLARRGYVAHVIHYFDLTGTKLADLPTMKANFPVWLLAVADGVSFAAKQPNVDPERIGVLGFSLGGFLSVSLAMFDARVNAVVEYFGGLPVELQKDLKSLPPTLILHGDADRVVPVAEAKTLEKLCVEKNVKHEVRIYAGQGHFFLGDDGRDAISRTLAFFDAHVKQTITRHEVARPKFDLLPGGAPKNGFASVGKN